MTGLLVVEEEGVTAVDQMIEGIDYWIEMKQCYPTMMVQNNTILWWGNKMTG